MTGTQTHCHTGAPRFPSNYAYGGGPGISSQVYINSCTDVCTHSKQGVGPQPGWKEQQTKWHTGAPNFPCNYPIGGGPDMGCKVDINSCTDACTHSKQGVATEMRWLGHKHTPYRGTQVFIKLCIWGGPDVDSQVDIKSCTHACTHSKQDGTTSRVTGKHTVKHRGTQDSIKLCIGDGRDMGSQVDINSCTGGSHLSHTAVKPNSHLACIFVAKFLCVIKLIIIIG